MKKYLVILLLFCIGCTSANIPLYLQDQNSYQKRFYASHDKTLGAILMALEDLGWEVEQKTDPVVYEQRVKGDLDEDELLVITTTRQTPLFFGTRYARMNIYLRSKQNTSEVEIRYLTISSVIFKNIKSYRNDSAVERIFSYIDGILSQ